MSSILRAILCEHINLFMSNGSVPEIGIDFIFFPLLLAHLLKPAHVTVGIVKKDVKEGLGKM